MALISDQIRKPLSDAAIVERIAAAVDGAEAAAGREIAGERALDIRDVVEPPAYIWSIFAR
jgi:hypothetical protein